jgi:hypothetical protein
MRDRVIQHNVIIFMVCQTLNACIGCGSSSLLIRRLAAYPESDTLKLLSKTLAVHGLQSCHLTAPKKKEEAMADQFLRRTLLF